MYRSDILVFILCKDQIIFSTESIIKYERLPKEKKLINYKIYVVITLKIVSRQLHHPNCRHVDYITPSHCHVDLLPFSRGYVDFAIFCLFPSIRHQTIHSHVSHASNNSNLCNLERQL